MTFIKGQIPWNKNTKGVMKPNKTSFSKGLIPWNKELKGIHLSKKSEFKKGSIPKNKVKIGTIVIRNGHKKRQAKKRRWIKIEEPNKWILYANYIWIKYKKILNKGMIIHHKDKNSLNDKINNLEELTRKDHMNIHRKDLKSK
jgi:hypothetical protein